MTDMGRLPNPQEICVKNFVFSGWEGVWKQTPDLSVIHSCQYLQSTGMGGPAIFLRARKISILIRCNLFMHWLHCQMGLRNAEMHIKAAQSFTVCTNLIE